MSAPGPAPLGALSRPPRLRRRPTGRGAALFLCGIGLFLLATHFASNPVFLLAFFCIALPVCAPVAAWSAPRAIRVHALPHEPLAPLEPAVMRFRLSPAPGPSARVTLETDLGPARPTARAAEWALRRDDLTRGLHDPGEVRLVATDPLGLFRACRPLDAAEDAGLNALVVHPRPDWRRPAAPEAPEDQGRAAEQGGEIAGLRPWRSGDRRRDVDWRASARIAARAPAQGGGADLAVREHEAQHAARACIFALPPGLGPQEAERALSRIAAGVFDAAREGAPVGLRLPGRSIPPGAGPGPLARILEALADYDHPEAGR